jgi:hypothetical protein
VALEIVLRGDISEGASHSHRPWFQTTGKHKKCKKGTANVYLSPCMVSLLISPVKNIFKFISNFFDLPKT